MTLKKIKEIRNFILHLRLPYNFLLLTGPFLAGALFSQRTNLVRFIFYYIVFFVFFMGGVNAYNSYYDRDTGPIGGLKYPPKMKGWMLYAAIGMQITALILSIKNILLFWIILISMVLSVSYSHPSIRLKAKPIESLILIFFSVIMGFLAGFFAYGGINPEFPLIIISIGVSMIITGIYPISQAYQTKEDLKRGDKTFFVKYGYSISVKLFFVMYILSTIFIGMGIYLINWFVSLVYAFFSMIIFLILNRKISHLKLDYNNTMRLKYLASGLFIIVIAILFLIKL